MDRLLAQVPRLLKHVYYTKTKYENEQLAKRKTLQKHTTLINSNDKKKTQRHCLTKFS